MRAEDAGQNPPAPGESKYYNEQRVFQQALFAADWTTQLQNWKGVDHGKLQAKTGDVEQASKEPCAIPPTSQYRKLENQLYRVEIHDGGDPAGATFKWSRENGTVMFPIISQISGGANQTSLTLTLGNLGRDDSRFGLSVDDWVEIVSVADEMEGEPGPLMRVQTVEPASRQVTLASHGNNGVTIPDHALFLRRWDYRAGDPSDKSAPQIANSGALQIIDGWLTLEGGIQIQFIADTMTTYRNGDYWLIPARTATGSIEWPRHNDHPESLPPHGVKHYYAPLCHVKLTGGKIAQDSDLIHLRKVIARQ